MEARELRSVLTSHDMFIGGFAGGRRADLRGADLYGADLTSADLRNANFRPIALSSRTGDRPGRFWYPNLHMAILRGAELDGAYFKQADLQEVDWDGAAVGGAVFESCKLDDAGRGYLAEHGATVR